MYAQVHAFTTPNSRVADRVAHNIMSAARRFGHALFSAHDVDGDSNGAMEKAKNRDPISRSNSNLTMHTSSKLFSRTPFASTRAGHFQAGASGIRGSSRGYGPSFALHVNFLTDRFHVFFHVLHVRRLGFHVSLRPAKFGKHFCTSP